MAYVDARGTDLHTQGAIHTIPQALALGLDATRARLVEAHLGTVVPGTAVVGGPTVVSPPIAGELATVERTVTPPLRPACVGSIVKSTASASTITALIAWPIWMPLPQS